MSRKFAWCLDDQHAKPDGSGCPGVIGGADGLVCSCRCHGEIALQVRGLSVGACDNGDVKREPDRVNESDSLATVSTKPKGA